MKQFLQYIALILLVNVFVLNKDPDCKGIASVYKEIKVGEAPWKLFIWRSSQTVYNVEAYGYGWDQYCEKQFTAPPCKIEQGNWKEFLDICQKRCE
jgi:hypothetical protein